MKILCGILIWIILLVQVDDLIATPSDSVKLYELYQKGVILKRKYQYDSAWHYFKICEKGFLEGQYWAGYFKCQKQFSRLTRDDQIDIYGALEIIDSAIMAARPVLGAQHAELAELLDCKANTLQSMDKLEASIPVYHESLQIRKAVYGAESGRVATSLNNLSSVLRKMDRNRQAIEYLKAAIDMYDSSQTAIRFLVNIHINISMAYRQIKDFDQAGIHIRKAVDLANSYHNQPNGLQIYAYYQLGSYFRDIEDYPQAEIALLKALDFVYALYEKGGHRQEGTISLALMQLYNAWGKTEKATEFGQKAIGPLSERFGPKSHAAYGLNHEFGRTAQIEGRHQDALGYYEKALCALKPECLQPEDLPQIPQKDMVRSEHIFGLWRNMIISLKALSNVKTDNLKYHKKILDLLNEMLLFLEYDQARIATETEKAELLHKYRFVFEAGLESIYILWNAGGESDYLEDAFRFMEQSRANLLTEALRDRRAKNFVGVPAEILDQESRLKLEIEKIRHNLDELNRKEAEGTPKRLTRLQNRLAELQFRQDSLMITLKQRHPIYFRLKYANSLLSLSELQSKLKNGQAVIEYFWGENALYLMAIENERVYFLRNTGQQSVQSAVEIWINSLRNPGMRDKQEIDPDFAENGYFLYQQLLQPIWEKVPPASLIIIPHGPLGYIPFELMGTDSLASAESYSQFPYLIKDSDIRYAFSASWLFQNEMVQKSAPNRFVGFAPKYGAAPTTRSMGSLAYASEESELIAEKIGGEVYIGKDNLKDVFLHVAEQYQILHLALHAFTDDEKPLYAGLAFGEAADEILYAYEINNLKLQADLAVLSACNTGVGRFAEGEGILSLARSFAYAGCPSIVMSLWPVDDESTRDLMLAFYHNLDKGLTYDAAIRQAKLDYLNLHDQIHPYYWGGFVMVGKSSVLSDSYWELNEWLGLLALVLALVMLALIARKLR